MWTQSFWKAAAERALRTVAQVLLTTWVAKDALNVLEIDWLQSFGLAGGAALVSVLMSLAPVGPGGSPSWVEEPTGRHAA
jgi:hypothetical protein